MNTSSPDDLENELELEEEDERHAFWDAREIRLMLGDLLTKTRVPLMEQPDVLRKIMILNYALGEWNDDFERRYGHLKLKKKKRSKEEILNEILQQQQQHKQKHF